MKFICLLLLLLITSCSSIKKDYVCGDHTCLNKKEFNEYFSKNLTIEVRLDENKKNKKIDLIRQNTEVTDKNDIDSIGLKKKKYMNTKKKKEKLKTEKTKALEQQKILQIKEKSKIEEKVLTTKILKRKEERKNLISNNREVAKKIIDTTNSKNKEVMIENAKKNKSNSTVKTTNMKNICDGIKDCDIDKIAELLINRGKNKPFPNITSN
jgi:hypothetical protein